jgi:hypothetical protein
MVRVKKDEMGEVCNTHGKHENAYKIFVGKYERMISLVRPGHGWENNIKAGRYSPTRLHGVTNQKTII